jgi:AcrR family transcriptional regulator
MAQSNTSQKTRQQILDAALRLFGTHGYAGTSTQAIVAASRVSKPAIYYYFGSKEGLFQTIIDEIEDQLFASASHAVGKSASVHDQLVELSAAAFEFAQENPSALGVLALELLPPMQRYPHWNQCLTKIKRRHAVIGKIVDQGIREGILQNELTSEELVVSFLGLLHNHILHFLANPHWPLNRRTAEIVVSLFLHGAETGASQTSAIQTAK